MMLPLNLEHKKYLELLAEQPTNVLQSFCKLSLDYFQKGHNNKAYNAATQKLDMELETLKQYVDGLVYLLIECVINKINAESFKELVISLGFTDDKEALLSKLYATKESEIQLNLQNVGFKLPKYHNMEWRFEAQIASRSLLDQLEPLVTIDLALKNVKDSDTPEHIILQSDITNIVHLSKELETALQEGRSQHMRKIQRIGKQI